jgi:hypothetical protein
MFCPAASVQNVSGFLPRKFLFGGNYRFNTHNVTVLKVKTAGSSHYVATLPERVCYSNCLMCIQDIYLPYFILLNLAWIMIIRQQRQMSTIASILLPPTQQINNSVSRCLIHLPCSSGIIRLFIQPAVTPQNLWITNCKFITNYFEIIQSLARISSAFELLSPFNPKFT